MGKHRWARGKAVSPRDAVGRGVHRLLQLLGGRIWGDLRRTPHQELRTRARGAWAWITPRERRQPGWLAIH